MKRTPLYDKHLALGAKMVPFAGFEMPVSYAGINVEHQCVRQQVGVFDVSHMGQFTVKGPQAKALLQWTTSNDLEQLKPGKAQYSCFPNHTGGIVDDLIIYQIAEDDYFLVVNASNIDKDFAHLEKENTSFGALLNNLSDDYALLAVQGPLAPQTLQPLTQVSLGEIPYYHFTHGTLAGIDNVLISATGYTGAGGFELYVPKNEAAALWDAVLHSGSSLGIQPVGLAARDTLRLEMGYCLYGNDINDHTSPISAGLGWITKFTKPFINSETLRAEKEAGSERKLVGFKLLDRGIPRHDYILENQAGQAIGVVTSGTMSPSLSEGIGMGYLDRAYCTLGTKIFVRIRDKQIPAEIVKLPFYKA